MSPKVNSNNLYDMSLNKHNKGHMCVSDELNKTWRLCYIYLSESKYIIYAKSKLVLNKRTLYIVSEKVYNKHVLYILIIENKY